MSVAPENPCQVALRAAHPFDFALAFAREAYSRATVPSAGVAFSE